ncbi:MAG TPA: SDR family NAD(P)-dependent oxidoreductase [Verrucomicrobiae bacterium]|nr:SDR family NAD(P)-dependent oxidoreductase [Verrucomicrobiae bacterium]
MIVVTGASDGLGRELARVFVENGKDVYGLSRSKCEDGVRHITTDLMDDESVVNAATQLSRDPERLEALINCAGVLSVQKIEELTSSEIDRVFDTNIKGLMLLTSRLMDKIKQDGADIVNVSSTVGTKAYIDQAAYGASKWAVRGFSANLQVELKDTPCRVISFCPGGFESRTFEKATGHKNPAFTFSMKPKDLALFIKQILDLPKNMEVSEVIINRKANG